MSNNQNIRVAAAAIVAHVKKGGSIDDWRYTSGIAFRLARDGHLNAAINEAVRRANRIGFYLIGKSLENGYVPMYVGEDGYWYLADIG